MNWYRFLADVIVVFHLAYVLFVMLGLVAILLGVLRGWSWVRNFWFRAIHFLMIAVVVMESLCGLVCPLTEWEGRLRELGGEGAEPSSFIGRWINRVLFVEVPPAVFEVCYCTFGLAVLLTLVLAPPRWPWKRRSP